MRKNFCAKSWRRARRMGEGRPRAAAAPARLGEAQISLLVEADDLARAEQAVPACHRRLPDLVRAARFQLRRADPGARSEERRVGTEFSTRRYRWSPYHSKTKPIKLTKKM